MAQCAMRYSTLLWATRFTDRQTHRERRGIGKDCVDAIFSGGPDLFTMSGECIHSDSYRAHSTKHFQRFILMSFTFSESAASSLCAMPYKTYVLKRTSAAPPHKRNIFRILIAWENWASARAHRMCSAIMQIDIKIDNFRMRSASCRQNISHHLMNHFIVADRFKLNSRNSTEPTKISIRKDDTLIESLMDFIVYVLVMVVYIDVYCLCALFDEGK